ncbi:uncharacterized protein EAE98_006695 [Botrytis deweyae]|uniref:Carboxylesterase type B domain-containing protein n=1 Tax=Botrytis deweyae TaxID=2478750 RepID=A0ABQ7IK21_9HELO|nr:uncharacterized protein EAE98_006695 [Botrytis deweyae]KAF7926400.1 hypothetical protein EAE98_006695 [Botrytis deweyae]
MDNSNASNSSNAVTGRFAAANDEERPAVYGGITLGYAKRPVLRTTDANYKGLKKDFCDGGPIMEQIACIRVRRVSIPNLLNPAT